MHYNRIEHRVLSVVLLDIFHSHFVRNLVDRKLVEVVHILGLKHCCSSDNSYHHRYSLVQVVRNLLRMHHHRRQICLHHLNCHIVEVVLGVGNLDYEVVHELLCVLLEVVLEVQQQYVLVYVVVVLLVLR